MSLFPFKFSNPIPRSLSIRGRCFLPLPIFITSRSIPRFWHGVITNEHGSSVESISGDNIRTLYFQYCFLSYSLRHITFSLLFWLATAYMQSWDLHWAAYSNNDLFSLLVAQYNLVRSMSNTSWPFQYTSPCISPQQIYICPGTNLLKEFCSCYLNFHETFFVNWILHHLQISLILNCISFFRSLSH